MDDVVEKALRELRSATLPDEAVMLRYQEAQALLAELTRLRSLAAGREAVIESCAKVADETAAESIAECIRALKRSHQDQQG